MRVSSFYISSANQIADHSVSLAKLVTPTTAGVCLVASAAGDTYQELASAGTSGYYLKSQGAGAVPVMAAPSTSYVVFANDLGNVSKSIATGATEYWGPMIDTDDTNAAESANDMSFLPGINGTIVKMWVRTGNDTTNAGNSVNTLRIDAADTAAVITFANNHDYTYEEVTGLAIAVTESSKLTMKTVAATGGTLGIQQWGIVISSPTP